MQYESLTLPSSDGITALNGHLWTPDPGIPVKALMQLVHGMAEHMARYAEFAEYLTGFGYAVIGHDHLGHGQSVIDDAHRCYFAKEDGHKKLIEDMHLFTAEGKKRFPGVPNFILGHSMGSFLLRRYITKYSNDISGAVIMGTGRHSLLETDGGLLIIKTLKLFKGDLYRSTLVNNMAIGGYDKPFASENRPGAWLSKRPEVSASYATDPLCGQLFTLSAWNDFMTVMRLLAKKSDFGNIRKDLPLMLVSGSVDPVGGEKAVTEVYEEYLGLGMKDVTLRLFPDDRHEILNETDREYVMNTIKDWLDARI